MIFNLNMNDKKYISLKRNAILLLIFSVTSISAFPQRLMEKLNRGTVAVATDDGVFVSWRKFATDTNNVTYNLYRDNSLVNSTPISDVSNYLDTEGTEASYYFIKVMENGEVTEISDPVVVWADGYKEVPLQLPDDSYYPDDCSVADLDGDNEMEIIVKMENSHRDNSDAGITDPVYLQAYKLNGTLLWSINLGVNIRAGSHYTQFMVYDLDGDGLAEVACKTAPGTMDGRGNYLSEGPAADDYDTADYRRSDGFIIEGPEYLTVFNGKTGAEATTVYYVPDRYPTNGWGKTSENTNRLDRFLACVAYFDTIPSLVMCRGYYGRSVLAAWDYKDGELTKRWVFDTDSSDFVGKDGEPYENYAGMGAHSLSVGDVDGDGKDEIVYGAMAVDDDGVGLWTSGNAHGDATHLGDFLPDREGLEYFMPSESANYSNKVTDTLRPAVWFAEAESGDIIWSKFVDTTADIGRAMVDDISSENPGCEFWGYGKSYKTETRFSLGVYDSAGNDVENTSGLPSINFGSWWDGDLTREILSGTTIYKWSTTSKETYLNPDDCEYNNSTKAVPALSGDILGDWREEVIWRTSDNQSLRIYTTTIESDYGLYTLLQDPQYRLALVWQNVGYNQPPHPGFFIGDNMPEPPMPSFKIVDPGITSIQITNPVENYLLELGNSISVSLQVLGLSDTTTIYLANGETILDTIKGAPYITIFEALELPSGDYNLIAYGYDADSNKIESSPISMTIDEGYPHITLTSPEDGVVYDIDDSITLSADSYDSDGTIDSVSYYFNGTIAATVKDSPYSITIENPGYGVYDIMAIVTDNDLKTDTSETVTVDVGKTVVIQEDTTGFCGFLTTGTFDTDHDGYTGEGFANSKNATGAGISWAINIVEEGSYKFYWRYATEDDRPAIFTLNDSIGETTLDFASTEDSWEVWELQASDEMTLAVGEYEVVLTATTSGGLGNIDYLKVLSFNDQAAEIFECDSLGEPEQDQEEEEEPETNALQSTVLSDNISIYPIPASELLNVEVLNGGVINNICIYDVTGKVIMNENYSSEEVTLNISQLQGGMYMLKLSSSQDTRMKKLIVK